MAVAELKPVHIVIDANGVFFARLGIVLMQGLEIAPGIPERDVLAEQGSTDLQSLRTLGAALGRRRHHNIRPLVAVDTTHPTCFQEVEFLE